MRFVVLAFAVAAAACSTTTEAQGIPEYTYQVVHTYPHDTGSFTEGLFFQNGFLYEGTGDNGHSYIRKLELETGKVLQQRDLPFEYFGEGIVAWKDRLIQMTYTSEKGFIYDLNTFAPKGEFTYKGQGWAFTTDGKKLYMDGSRDVHAGASDPIIRIWDPETLKETGVINVTADGRPLENINELEWVKGEIYANIWQTDRIARIDPKTGKVVGWIDLTGLLAPADRTDQTDVLNGIAYDAAGDRLFVTGKRWPKLFEIRLVKKSGSQ
jgi:glutaminyl-peptide cyclotransferase